MTMLSVVIPAYVERMRCPKAEKVLASGRESQFEQVARRDDGYSGR